MLSSKIYIFAFLFDIKGMNFRAKLSERIGINEIHEITFLTQGRDERKQELYELLFDSDDKIAYQAAWVFTHFNLTENKWLYDKQDELIDEVLKCTHPGKRRLLLNILLRQTITQPPRTDFLDFCLDRMMSKQELPGVHSLCMKLAYEMCYPIPELLSELRSSLEIMEPAMLSAGTRTARKNVLKAVQKAQSKSII